MAIMREKLMEIKRFLKTTSLLFEQAYPNHS